MVVILSPVPADPVELAAAVDVLARAIGADAADAERVMGAASAMVERYAPTAPQSIQERGRYSLRRCASAIGLRRRGE